MSQKIIEKIKFIYKGAKYMINLYLAILIYNLFYKKEKNQNIITMGSSNGKYSDENITELFRYLVDKKKEVYYIIDKNNTDFKKIENIGKVLYRFSFKANLIVLKSKIMVYDRSFIDIIRCNKKYISHIKKINVMHGIQAFKRKDKDDLRSRTSTDDYVIATSDYEKEIKENWGFSPESIYITGFPRFDKLYREEKNKKSKNIIFYMPTWRPWFKRGFLNPTTEELEKFKNSNYFKNIIDISKSDKLNQYLKEKNYKLEIYLHKLMQKYFKQLNIDDLSNIKFLNDSTSIQEKVLESKMLITDYSSIIFDFLFLSKPVILYQFDKEKYYKNIPGSYIEFDEIDSLLVKDTNELIYAIKKHINQDNYEPNNQCEKLVKKYIKHFDDENSKRVYDLIEEIQRGHNA